MADIRKLEIELIDAAFKERRTLGKLLDTSELTKSIDRLLFECDDCNYDWHRCPGDGKPIPHGAGNCGEHDDDAPILTEREKLADALAEYAAGTVQEWMRIVDLDEPRMQARASWQDDGTFSLGEAPYSDDFGRYRLIVKVEALPDLPPIGPENDPAQIEEQKCDGHCSGQWRDPDCSWHGTPRLGQVIHTTIEEMTRPSLAAHSTGYCIECTDGDEDPRAWCDCGNGDDPPCLPPCRQRAHAPENCPSRTEWIASTFLHIEKGDMLRIGQDVAEVKAVSKLGWHVDNSDRYHPKPWEHVELRADVGFGMTSFPTDTAVEILCDEERKAQLIMSEAGLRPRLSSTEEN